MSSDGRSAALREMARAPVDLLVLGGGITGAGVARDAALRGMRVAIVDKDDFASGTSSRSSKIIHGGVRYLEYFQLGLVRESARERAILRRQAPHLVHPLPFLYPVFGGESLLKIRAGLKLFDRLAGSPREERSRHLTPADTRRYLPGLRDPLQGSVLYPEFVTDDARFTLANIASAAENGGLVANHARVESFIRTGERVTGARIRDLEEDTELEVRAGAVVNAGGPWAQRILEDDDLPMPKRIVPSKGIHILFERDRLPLRAATFLRASSGRRGLAIPRGPWVYVGTSDTEYAGDLDRPRATAEEVGELLEMTRDCFPSAELTVGDVKRSWAGIRPLVHQEGKSTRDTSRHDEVWLTCPGLVTVAGGKLTTYRPMARRILEATARTLDGGLPGRSTTESAPLTGRPEESLDRFRSRMRHALQAAGVETRTVDRLLFLYGSEIETLLDYGTEDPDWMRPLAPGEPALRGEVRMAAEQGMGLTLADVMDRRLALLLFDAEGGWRGAPAAASILTSCLGWSLERKEEELKRYVRLVHEHGPGSVDTGPARR